MAHNILVNFFTPLYALAWFPSFRGPSLAWETVSTGWVSCCYVDTRQGLVVAVRGMAPLASPITTGNCRSFSADCPVSKGRLSSFSIIMGVVHFIPSARLMDGVH